MDTTGRDGRTWANDIGTLVHMITGRTRAHDHTMDDRHDNNVTVTRDVPFCWTCGNERDGCPDCDDGHAWAFDGLVHDVSVVYADDGGGTWRFPSVRCVVGTVVLVNINGVSIDVLTSFDNIVEIRHHVRCDDGGRWTVTK